MQKQQGIGTTTYAIDFFLECLYTDYGDLIDKRKNEENFCINKSLANG
jgi:hypothetical protein